MRVLVVGGTGFIGGHVARAFRDRGDDVTAVVRDGARARSDTRLVGVRLLDVASTAPEATQDVVVYAAGAWTAGDTGSPSEVEGRCHEVYVRGVTRFAEMSQRWGAHFVFMSGTSRYGFIPGVPVAEETPPATLSVFGVHKRKAEAILAATPGLRWTAIAPPEVYGARDSGSYLRFVYERVRSRRFFLIGHGYNRWSLCNVKNVVHAIVKIAPGPGHHVLNVTDARAWTQRDLGVAVARALGRSSMFLSLPRSLVLAAATIGSRLPLSTPRLTPNHVRVRAADIVFDASKANRLGIESHASLDEGVAEAVAWWERQRFSVYQFSRVIGDAREESRSPKSS